MSRENSMKGLVVSIQGDAPLQQKWCVPATTSNHSGQTPLTSQRDADDAKSLHTFHAPLLKISTV